MKWYSHPLLHILVPHRCACCGKVIYPQQALCEECERCLPRIPDGICGGCGNPKKKCACRHGHRTLFPCESVFFYEEPVRDGILTLKERNALHGVPYFAEEMAKTVRARFGYSFDGVVYVPVTKKKLRKRGYNQCHRLAKALAKELGIPLLDNALVRLYDTPDQHQSSLATRKGKVFGVFEADPKLVRGKHLLLVDDIITTGATIGECGKMLYLADCEEVCGITIASTVYKKEDKKKEQMAPTR